MNTTSITDHHLQKVTQALFLLGIGLAGYKLILAPSLYIDEAMLALNFIERDFLGLTRTLDNLQVAPILFLWGEKLLFDLGKGNDVFLRFWPFIWYLGVLLLFWKLIHLLFQREWLRMVGMLLFVFNVALLEYAIMIKQYMGDVFLTLLILWLLIRKWESPKQQLWVVAAVGAVGIFFSHISPLLLAAAAVHLFFFSPYSKIKLLPIFGLWALVFGLNYILFIHRHPLKEGMGEFWTIAMGFVPDISEPKRLFTFFKWNFVNIFRKMLSMWTFSKYLIFLLVLTGITMLLYRKKWSMFILLMLPMLLHLILSALKLYPFAPRLILYFIPLLILLSLFGLEEYLCKLKKFPKIAFQATILSMFLFSFWKTMAQDYPGLDPGVRKGMQALADELDNSPGRVYVSWFFSSAFKYYDQVQFREENWQVLEISDLYGGLAKNLGDTKSEESDFFLFFSQVIVPYEALLEEIEAQKGRILSFNCYDECCLLHMEWE